jgi:hypothetical protein
MRFEFAPHRLGGLANPGDDGRKAFPRANLVIRNETHPRL